MLLLLEHRHDDEAKCRAMFTPYTSDVRFLLCRQIVREMGEATNLRACGLNSVATEKGTQIEVVMPERIKEYCLAAMKHNSL
jgi:hypothetical protein